MIEMVFLQQKGAYNDWNNRKLNWDVFGNLIKAGLENPNTSELLKKYLPQIKARSVCHTVEAQADTIIAKWLCSIFYGKSETNQGSKYKLYRKLKSTGTAHQWQQLISKHKMLEIDFDTVHGRALAQLVSGKFLANQGLEAKYETWIESKPVAKYTGYVYELLSPVKDGYRNNKLKSYQESTINKQFYGMVETAKNGMNENSSLLVVVDSSSSMTDNVPGTKVSSYDVAKSMALFFSYLLKGPFEKAWMEFNSIAKLKFWTGSTPVLNLQNDNSEAYGSTDFQSVARVWVDMIKQGIPEAHFPTGILCVSDGCFNTTSKNKTNYNALRASLWGAGFSVEYLENFKVILWDIPNSYYGSSQPAKFEDFADTPGLFHLSGLDGSIIAFITGTKSQEGKALPKTSEELFLAAMDQEVLNLIEV